MTGTREMEYPVCVQASQQQPFQMRLFVRIFFSSIFEMVVQKMKLTCDENCLKRSGHHAAIENLFIVLGGIQLQLRLGQLLGHVPTLSWPVLLREVQLGRIIYIMTRCMVI